MIINSKIISVLLLLTYSTMVFRVVFPLVEYAANYTYIISELCEQKDNPENMCHGKCHLKKEIQKQIDPPNESSKMILLEIVKIPHTLISNTAKTVIKISHIYFKLEFFLSIIPTIKPLLPPPKF